MGMGQKVATHHLKFNIAQKLFVPNYFCGNRDLSGKKKHTITYLYNIMSGYRGEEGNPPL